MIAINVFMITISGYTTVIPLFQAVNFMVNDIVFVIFVVMFVFLEDS